MKTCLACLSIAGKFIGSPAHTRFVFTSVGIQLGKYLGNLSLSSTGAGYFQIAKLYQVIPAATGELIHRDRVLGSSDAYLIYMPYGSVLLSTFMVLHTYEVGRYSLT